MKRKLWIILALAALILALGCGGAMAADETVETKSIFGIVNASTLPDNADIVLTADTTIIMDVQKRVNSIRGPHGLRIEGEKLLEVYLDAEFIDENGIDVSSFYSSADFLVSCTDSMYIGLNAQNSITVDHAHFSIYGTHYGIYSANGNITLNCAKERPGNDSLLSDSSDTCSVKRGIYAANGSVSVTGQLIPINVLLLIRVFMRKVTFH